MATQMQLRGGTTAENLLFTGAQREITVDTDKHSINVHDGVTAGGYALATSQQVSNGTFYYNEGPGSAADAYILTPKANTNVPSAYLDGIQFGFVTAFPNTGAATANFQGLGVKNLKYAGGTDPLAGELNGRVYVIYDATNGWLEIQRKATGTNQQIRTISASVSGSNLTLGLAPCTLDFRAALLNNGLVNTRNVVSALSLTVPNGATLGTTSTVQARLVLLAIYGPVNVELAVINIAGGVNLDETTTISTTAISASSNSAAVAYSTTARASVPFRVVGFTDLTQATAGAWATSPTVIQGAGGMALAALSSLGYGQTWTDVTASRVSATTYTNTTGKPIMLSVWGAASGTASIVVTVSGIIVSVYQVNSLPGVANTACMAIVPPGATYSVTITAASISKWIELR